jgi:hypothetical protein
MKRLRPADVLTYREAATVLAHPSTATIARLVALGLLDGLPTPFGLAVTRASVEQLRRWRQAGEVALVPGDGAARQVTVPRRERSV